MNEYNREGVIIQIKLDNLSECDYHETSSIRRASKHDECIFDIENVYESFKSVRRASYYKSNVQTFWWYHLRYSYLISKKLKQGLYKPQEVDEFELRERGHIRHIKANKVNDRVVNNVLATYLLWPLTDCKLIYDNAASRKGYGTDHSRRRLEKHLHDSMINYGEDTTILLSDVSKFFDSIPIDDLLSMYKDIIDNDEYYEVLENQIKAHNEGEIGIGIGSVISQNAGLYYLHRFDNFIKIVLSRKYYGRYMDDFYIICKDKQEANELKNIVKNYIETETKLHLNEKKTQIVKLTHEFTYLKFRYKVTPSGKVKKRQCSDTFKRERRKLKKFKNTKMTDEEILQAYKSWRGTIVTNKYNQPRLYKTDMVFKAEYPRLANKL